MTAPTPAAGGAGVDELLDPSFLDGVQELPMVEVRALRHRASRCATDRCRRSRCS